MKCFVFLISLFSSLSTFASLGQQVLDQAIQQARQENKAVLIEVCISDASPCDLLKRGFKKKPELVEQIKKNYILLRLEERDTVNANFIEYLPWSMLYSTYASFYIFDPRSSTWHWFNMRRFPYDLDNNDVLSAEHLTSELNEFPQWNFELFKKYKSQYDKQLSSGVPFEKDNSTFFYNLVTSAGLELGVEETFEFLRKMDKDTKTQPEIFKDTFAWWDIRHGFDGLIVRGLTTLAEVQSLFPEHFKNFNYYGATERYHFSFPLVALKNKSGSHAAAQACTKMLQDSTNGIDMTEYKMQYYQLALTCKELEFRESLITKEELRAWIQKVLKDLEEIENNDPERAFFYFKRKIANLYSNLGFFEEAFSYIKQVQEVSQRVNQTRIQESLMVIEDARRRNDVRTERLWIHEAELRTEMITEYPKVLQIRMDLWNSGQPVVELSPLASPIR